jgi:hypothetical protein
VNIDYESFNSNDMLSINQIITLGQDDIINNVLNDNNFKNTQPVIDLMTSGPYRSNSDYQISYFRNEFTSKNLTWQVGAFDIICKLGYLKMLGKILNLYGDKPEIVDTMSVTIMQNIDALYTLKQGLSSDEDANSYKNTYDTNYNSCFISKQTNYCNTYKTQYENDCKSGKIAIANNDATYDAQCRNENTALWNIYLDQRDNCWNNKKRDWCFSRHSKESGKRSECIRGEIGKSNTEDSRFTTECNIEISNALNNYNNTIVNCIPIKRQNYCITNELEKCKKGTPNDETYKTECYNQYRWYLDTYNYKKGVVFPKNEINAARTKIDANLKNLPSVSKYGNQLNDDTGDTGDAATAPKTDPAIQDQKKKIIYQQYVFSMKDICNVIINTKPDVYSILNSGADNNNLQPPLYINRGQLDILSNGIEPLILSLRDSGGAGGLGGLGGDSSGFPSL